MFHTEIIILKDTREETIKRDVMVLDYCSYRLKN